MTHLGSPAWSRRHRVLTHRLDYVAVEPADLVTTARTSSRTSLGPVHVTEERELLAVRRRLGKFPEATQAVAQVAHALRRSIPDLNADEVESWANPAQPR
jgi:hypothetical protein